MIEPQKHFNSDDVYKSETRKFLFFFFSFENLLTVESVAWILHVPVT
jgi:hypothetical protein